MNIQNNKKMFAIIVISTIILSTIGLYVYKKLKTQENIEDVTNEQEEERIEYDEKKDIEGKKIVVHVTGNIKNQGIIVLKEGDRIADAIKMAGGETENA